jgi:hypothetical protein
VPYHAIGNKMNFEEMELFDQPTHLLVLGGVLLALILAFVSFFLVPGIIHAIRLRGIRQDLKRVGEHPKPDQLREIFNRDRVLAHLWKEYEETLHYQTKEVDGLASINAIRSTVPASAYFNSQYVIDTRLSTEFFKHLPGIFTGLGIIGTFSGLISGLDEFKVSDDPAKARDSLAALLEAVGEAFLVSAAAITAAMVVTFLEKVLVSSLYRSTEKIAHAIDAFFDSGVGEEYLERLVKASEKSDTHAKQLKDAIVEKLSELTERQIAGIHQANQQLGDRLLDKDGIARQIGEDLKGPLNEISRSIGGITKDTSTAATDMLTQVMADFSERLNQLFGGQIDGIKQGNQETIKAMQDTVKALQGLVGNLEDSSKRSSEALADQLAQAVAAMEGRQRAMNEESKAFIEQVRTLMQGSQAETQVKLQETLASLGDGMRAILAGLHENQEGFAQRTGDAVERVSGSVSEAVVAISGASDRMVGSVDRLSTVTRGAVEGMENSADRIVKAATSFVQAGESVRDVMANTAKVGSQLNELHGSLTVSARSLQEALNDYKEQRSAVQGLSEQVRHMLDGARREASITEDVLQRIERSAQQLKVAQDQADNYIKGINEVLGKSSAAFQSSVRDSLNIVNTDFHAKLSSAVNLLAGAIEGLGATLSDAQPRN